MNQLRPERGWLKAAYAIAVVQTPVMLVLVLFDLAGAIPLGENFLRDLLAYAVVYPICLGHYANVICVVIYLCRTDWSDGIWRSWFLIVGALAAGCLYLVGPILLFMIRGFGGHGL